MKTAARPRPWSDTGKDGLQEFPILHSDRLQVGSTGQTSRRTLANSRLAAIERSGRKLEQVHPAITMGEAWHQGSGQVRNPDVFVAQYRVVVCWEPVLSNQSCGKQLSASRSAAILGMKPPITELKSCVIVMRLESGNPLQSASAVAVTSAATIAIP